MDEARRIRDEGNRAGIAHAQMDWVVAQHNDLVQRFNQLVNASLKAGQIAETLQEQAHAKDQQIADLEHQLAISRAETLEVRQLLARTFTSLQNRARTAEDALRELRSQQG